MEAISSWRGFCVGHIVNGQILQKHPTPLVAFLLRFFTMPDPHNARNW